MFRFSALFVTGLLIATCCLFSENAKKEEHPRSRHVLVTISPYKFFVEQLAGDTVTVGILVPAGSSAHTFEPTPKQMLSASLADIWFRIGEPFERQAIASLTHHNPQLNVVDLRQELDLIMDHCHSHENGHNHFCADVHFWLSPRMMQHQVRRIAKALIDTYPEHEIAYSTRLATLLQELEDLDQKISKILEFSKNRTIIVGHPAYSYFCRDYGLTQMSIEFEGKDPTPQQLTTLLQQAREQKIDKIFIQPQHSSKGARLFARQLSAEVIMLDPYSEDYFNNMLKIAHSFAGEPS